MKQTDYYIHSEAELRKGIDDIANQLGLAVDGKFNFTVKAPIVDETLDKLAMLINFVIEAARRGLNQLADQNARLAELDRMKSVFLANVSHELRTPLTLILGPTEQLLADSSLKKSQKDHLSLIQRNARLLLKHVNDILDIAKLDSGRMELTCRETDIAELTRLTASNFDFLAAQKRIAYAVSAPATLIAEVDPEKLQRVLVNLLSNAFKFVPAGGEIQCRLSVFDGSFRLEVEDNGPGVKDELKAVIFERFRQGDAGPTRQFGGTGLGLAIVKDFVELHHGHVRVTDNPSGGACFVVEIPCRASIRQQPTSAPSISSELNEIAILGALDELSANAKPAAPISFPAASERPKLLVVEDNPEMNHFMAEIFADDYEVATALNGAEGLEATLRFRPDLIITDIMMPGMSGDEMIYEIRRRSGFADVPILVLTAKADDELLVRLLRESVQDYVVKPFTKAEVLARTKNLVTMSRTRKVLQQVLASQVKEVDVLAKEVVERKQELERALAIRDEFLSIASHELKTPITSLKLYLQLSRKLLSGPAADTQACLEKTQKSLDVSLRQVDFLTNLIEALLDVSRIQSGQLALTLGNVNVAELIEEVAGRFRQQLDAAAIPLSLDLDRQIQAYWDRYRIEQLLGNLLSNIIKYAPGKPATISVSRNGGFAKLVVEDSGPGIAREKQELIFERFERGTTAGAPAGLGLGLFISRCIVEAHQGEITLESALGHGTKFLLEIPLHPIVRQNAGGQPTLVLHH